MFKTAKRIENHRTLHLGCISPYVGALKIVFVTDVHYMPSRRNLYQAVLDTVRREDPDVVVFGGDFIDYRERWRGVIDWLRQFPDNLLKVAVPGNWEYYGEETSVRFAQRMRQANILPLCNQRCVLMKKGFRVHLVGIDDFHNGLPALNKTFTGVPDDECCIGVSHSPDVLADLEPRHHCNLMLCGHTHGGQIRLPGYGAIRTNTLVGKRFESGLYQLGADRFAYVSRGLGEGLVKARLFCPHELTVITLKHRWEFEGKA
jgi:hypothetical protein